MNKHTFYSAIILFCFFLLTSCSQKKTSSKTNVNNPEQSKTTKVQAQSDNSKPAMHPEYPNIPLAEKGITVVTPEGWDAKTMDFHVGYCAQMLANLSETYDPSLFCPCFLNKIQYYYEPIYFKEAYVDQQLWNQECLEEARWPE